MDLAVDRLSGGAGNDVLGIGYGDHADGGAGSDVLYLSLGGLQAGTSFDTAGIASGQPFTLGGGIIQNIETFAYLRGTEFADTLHIATHNAVLTVAAGAGDDVVISSGSSITLDGGAGDDRLISGAAGDIFDGGIGIDTADYRNATSGATVALAATAGGTGTGAGGDQLRNVENVDGSAFGDTLSGSNDSNLLRGMSGDDVLNGLGGDDHLVGGDGFDELNGGAGNDLLDGGAGADVMRGGAGDDTYLLEDVSDGIVEAAGEGNDLAFVSSSFILESGLSVETLSTRTHAGTEAIDLYGNAFGQTLIGNMGANQLDGRGGADVMVGLGGDDVYVIDDSGDEVREIVGEGNDVVFTSVSWVLSSNQSIEYVSTRDHAGTAAIDLTGNQLANTLYGNNGANQLNGNAGADVMIGLGGDDLYVVDNAGDQVIEVEGQGNDVLLTYVSYVLSNMQEVEILSTVAHRDTTAIDLYGNDYANHLYGNFGANHLNGRGGADVMTGFAGDDSYVIDNAGDVIEELAGDGNDAALTFVGYALAAGAEVELLSAAVHSDTAALDLTGNGFAQTVHGNLGANRIDGKGGSDTLIGLGGADAFAFTTALGADNVDSILDFEVGVDTIALDDAVFAALGSGALPAGAFRIGTAAADADDRIVYDAATGKLFYDADGNGAGEAVQFAVLQAGLTSLSASDFMVI